MNWFSGLKKAALSAVSVLVLQSSLAMANDISKCDYDDIFYGYGQLTINNGNYSFEFGDEVNGHTFTGSAKESIVAQIKYALDNAKTTESGGKEIALLMSMNKPVCASVVERASLYVQPNIIEKNTYYVVGVCTPETDSCWKMKIDKGSSLAGLLKMKGTLNVEGKTCIISYSPGNSIFSMYEDTNAE